MIPRHSFAKRPKYGVGSKARRTRDGITFDSILEADYYDRLNLEKRGGTVLFFLRQVPFHLPGGVRYVCDFQVFRSDGSVNFVDVKGAQTESFKAKRRQVEALYPIDITIVTRKDF